MRIRSRGRDLPGPRSAKARELLAFLLLHGARPHRRETVAEFLWDGEARADPRKCLRQALWHLQAALPGGRSLVESLDGDWIRIDPEADLRVDVHELDAAWVDLQRPERRAIDSPAWARAEKVLNRCGDELLEGAPWQWCLGERERLTEVYFLMADDVIAWRLATREPGAGLRLALRIVDRDPSREATHRLLMELHAERGDRTAALRQYERCALELRRTFGVAPDHVTQQLFERLRDGTRTPDTLAPLATSSATGLPARSVLHLLEDVRGLLSTARREVHTEIQTLERALKLPS